MEITVDNILNFIPVSVQYDLAKRLAANCGYQLVAQDNEQNLKVKELIKRLFLNNPVIFSSYENDLIITGLKGLLKC